MSVSSPNGASPSSRQSRIQRLSLWVPLGVILLSAVLLGLFAHQLRRNDIKAGTSLLNTLSRLIEEQTGRTLQSVSQTLEQAEARIQHLQGQSGVENAARQEFRKLLAERPFLRAIWVLDAKGVMTFDSDEGNIGLDLSDRDYFQFHLAHPDMDFRIHAPVLSRTMGRWFISATRTLRDPQGGFAGIIVAAVEPLYFDQVWDVDPTQHTDISIALMRRDGILLMRSPFDADAMSKSFAGAPLFREASSGVGSGNFEIVSLIDNTPRIFSYRTISAYPDVLLIVGSTVESMLASWRRYTVIILIGWLTASLILLAAGLSLRHEWRRRWNAEEQLRQSQKMESIGQLTGGVAHDFNNMLTVIIGSADIIAEKTEAGSPLHRAAQLILSSANASAELVRRLLAFSRRQSLEPQRIDIGAFAARAQDLLNRTLGATIEIRTAVADGTWSALADPTQLEAAVLNLAINSRDAMPEGGRITIETSNVTLDAAQAAPHDVKAGNYVVIAVTDNGSGMSEETIRRAFEPFFTTKEVGKGTGLGLSMVHGFAHQSGGFVEIRSALGQGTTIRLHLPATSGEDARR